MVDSDMHPDMYNGQPDARPFFQTSFDFLVNHYPKGPCAIGAPYCGPPPHECVYVFQWSNMRSHASHADFQLKMYERHEAAKMSGIQECAALPTGLIMYDMRAFELTEPKKDTDKPWFYYEWKDIYHSDKASTEDVTQTRDLSLAGVQAWGYNPVYCNWDAWAGHWKPLCVGKPLMIDAKNVSDKLKRAAELGVEQNVKLVNVGSTFDSMGMDLPAEDQAAIANLIHRFTNTYGRTPRVCEVGAWAGRSAIIMAKAGAQVTCVDTWEGSQNDAGCKAYDGSCGTPLEVFKRNTRSYPITAHVGRSPEAAQEFADGQFDIVYIDAEHDYESVKADISAWRTKAKHIVAGHDYHCFPDVAKAVKDCGIVPQVEGNVWAAPV
jgi:predicted O-methyltransferase YrrM